MKKIIGGCLCWILAGATGLLFALYALTNFTQPQQQFRAPGKLLLMLEAPPAGAPKGKLPEKMFNLWYDYKTTFEGKDYSALAKLPEGMQVAISARKTLGDAPAEISFQPVSGADVIVQKISGSERVKTGHFTLTPGLYELSVSGFTGEAVFSVDTGNPSTLTMAVFLLLAIGGSLGMLGLGLIWLGWRQRRNRRIPVENDSAPSA